MRGKSNVIKRNVEKVLGVRYTLGARYLPKSTVIAIEIHKLNKNDTSFHYTNIGPYEMVRILILKGHSRGEQMKRKTIKHDELSFGV
jgi:hypothetical protein